MTATMRGAAHRSLRSTLSALKPSTTNRSYSSTTTTTTPTPSPPSPPPRGLAHLPSRRLVSVSGPDASRYLQGVITSNLASSPPGFFSAFLSAQGRVLHDVIVWPRSSSENSYLVEVDAAEARTLERHIRRYKLRAKFDVRLLEEGEQKVWAFWGGGDGTGIVDPRCPALGNRVLGERRPELEMEDVSEGEYTVRRYLHGIPEGQREILRESALPLESNMDIMGGIDFRKGCYVGQELTIRTKHRGVVRKRILPVVVYDGRAPGELVYSADGLGGTEGGFGRAEEIPAETSIGRTEKKGRSAGKWLAGVGNLGLALCRLEIMSDLRLPGEAPAQEGEAAGEFVLTEKMEGGAVGRQVKVKAFVPEWLRRGVEAGG